MYHLTIGNKPICHHDPTRPCEYETRSKAFERATQELIAGGQRIAVYFGQCPANHERKE